MCDAISGEVGFPCACNLLSQKFVKLVLRPKSNCAGLNPLLLINAILAQSAQDSTVS